MADQPDELVIEFKTPIKNKAGDVITQITLREPTAAEWRKWDKLAGVDADIQAVVTVSGQPLSVIEQMAASQLVEGSNYIAGFLQPALKGGVSE
jgi:hypothetical protein